MQKAISAGEEIKSSVFTLPGPAAGRSDTEKVRRTFSSGLVRLPCGSVGRDLMELLPSLLSTLKAVDPQAVKEEYSVSLSLKNS